MISPGSIRRTPNAPDAGFRGGLGVATASATAIPPADGPRLRRHATPRSFDLTTVANAENYDELVARPRHPVHRVRGHRMLSFRGSAHVRYLPGQRILGLSELAWVVDKRPGVAVS